MVENHQGEIRGRGLNGKEPATRKDGRPGRRPPHQAALPGGATDGPHQRAGHSPQSHAQLRPGHHGRGRRGARYVTNNREGREKASHNGRYIKSRLEAAPDCPNAIKRNVTALCEALDQFAGVRGRPSRELSETIVTLGPGTAIPAGCDAAARPRCIAAG